MSYASHEAFKLIDPIALASHCSRFPNPVIAKQEPSGAFCVVGLILRDRDKGRTYNMAYDELLAPIIKSIQQHEQEIADNTASFERHRAARRQKLADLKTKIAELKEQIRILTPHPANVDLPTSLPGNP
jgi:hypothetical protein